METEPSAPEPDLYLIAHKVRGEPAFDIAHRLMIGDEEGWIIPTSGHRAYPYWHHPLDDAVDFDLIECGGNPLIIPNLDEVPDHYETTAAKGQGLVKDLLAALGLPQARPPQVTRRI